MASFLDLINNPQSRADPYPQSKANIVKQPKQSLFGKIFNPSPEVGAQRRMTSFGTTSKLPPIAVATAIGTLGLATVPEALGAVGAGVARGATGFLKLIGKSFVKAPIQTTAGVLIGGPLVVGALSKKPELITDLPRKSFNAGQALVNTIQDHPTASGIVGSVTGGVLAYEVGKKIFGDKNPTPNDNVPTLDSVTEPVEIGASSVGTQEPNPNGYASTDVPTAKRRRYKARPKAKAQPAIRINIINSNKVSNIGSKKLKYYNAIRN